MKAFVILVPFCGHSLFQQEITLLVDVLGFNFQLFFTGFAHPVVFSLEEGVVVHAFSIVFRAEITLHKK